ncbi:MAG: AsmA family protein [Alphaproteobacteria bacterium]|nr:AsmA family protein [Alphaproteobacteria bacterium]
MRLGLVLKVAAGILLLAVAGATLWLALLDVNAYRPRLAALVEAETGRRLDLRGEIDLRLLPAPALVVKDVTFQNAAWGSRPEMARLGELAASVQLMPLLFGGDVVITLISVRDLELLLETDGKGRANWVIGGASGPAPGEASGEGGREVRIPALERLELENVHLTYRDGASGNVTRFDLKRLRAELRQGARMAVTAEAAYREAPIRLEASLGPLPLLMQADTPYPLEAEFTLAGLRGRIAGTVRDAHLSPRLDLRIEAESDDLATLEDLAGVALPGSRPFRLAASLTGDIRREVRLGGIDLRLGSSSLAGDIALRLDGKRPVVAARVSAPRIDLADLRPSGGAASPAGAGSRQARQLFPDHPLPLEGLSALDGEVMLTVAELRGEALALADLALTAKLADRRLDVSPLSFRMHEGRIEGRVALDGRPARPAMAMELRGQQVDLGQAARQALQKDVMEGRADFRVDLKGSGQTVRQILSTLGGDTEVVIGQGRIRNRWLEVVSSDLVRLVTPWSSKDDSRLNCFVSRFQVNGGVMTSRLLLGDTERASLLGEGTVDLGRERIDMRFTPRPKEVSLMSLATPILVSGWLGEPAYRPDAVAVARGVAGAVGGIALGGGLLGGLVGAITGTSGASAAEANPCLAALARAGAGSAPAGRPQPAQQPREANPLDSVREGLRNLFAPGR